MRKPIDPVVKALVETSPPDWLPLLGLPLRPVTVIDADIATVLAGAGDKVLHVHDDPEYLLHLDFQSGHDSSRLPRRLRLYNTALDDRHEILVRSVAVLLHPGADSPQLTGKFERAFPGETPYAYWRYHVLRVWQVPVQQLLTGGVGTLPLAPIGNVRESELPEVIEQMQQRLWPPAERGLAPELWSAAYVLLGMRYSPHIADILLQGVNEMEESSTYQAIMEKGRVEGLAKGALLEARRLLLRQGKIKLGKPDAATKQALDAIGDIERLEELSERIFTTNSWNELLGLPTSEPRNKGRNSSR